MVLPLELLQQFKSSDFTDQEEYEAWQKRNLKILEAGLLIHPYVMLEKSNTASQRLRQIIHGALDRPLETGRNNESMQILRNAVMSLASRSSDGSLAESCHWADGSPLNLRLYEILLEALFDSNDETSIIEEVDEVMELIKKTWAILGINQMLHNLCFTWVLFNRFVATGQVENDLLYAADSQLAEVAKDAKTSKDPAFANILNSTLSSILSWAEKRLLAYHDTFDKGNIDTMQSIVSLGVSAAKILVEDISNEYRRKRKGEVDVARNRIDTYIRSSIRTAFAQASSSYLLEHVFLSLRIVLSGEPPWLCPCYSLHIWYGRKCWHCPLRILELEVRYTMEMLDCSKKWNPRHGLPSSIMFLIVLDKFLISLCL